MNNFLVALNLTGIQRICPGLELAINSIVRGLSTVRTTRDTDIQTLQQRINTMNLLWGFNFHPTKDPESGETLPCEIIDKTHVSPGRFFLFVS